MNLRQKFRLSPKAILVLSYMFITLFIGKITVTPIPLLAIIAHLMILPLTHLVSFRELFIVENIEWVVINIQTILNEPIIMGFFSPIIPTAILPSLYILFPIFLILETPFQALVSTIMMRISYHILPKRLKIERVGY